jgi:TRAP-type C4-dicarboxylate transport system permease small subunit
MSNSSLIAGARVAGRWLRRRAENVMVALLTLMFATFIIQIFARYVLNRPVGWSEEVIITAWLWTVLWGAAFVISEREEVRFDIIYSSLTDRVRRIFTVVTGLILITLYGISLPATYSYVSFMRVERSAYLHVPINWLYAVYVIFVVACIARYGWLVVMAIRGGKTPETDAARLSD